MVRGTYLEFEFDHKVGYAQWHPAPQPATLRWLVLRQADMFVCILCISSDPNSLAAIYQYFYG
jgi:hypothetical protein